jgi:hypothetical protein
MEEAVLIVLLMKNPLNLFSTESVVKIVETTGILGSRRLFATVCAGFCGVEEDRF